MSPGASLQRTLKLDGTPGPVRSMRKLVSAFLLERGVPEDVCRAIVLAFSEALDNAWEHGSQGQAEIHMRLRYTSRFVLVSVRDSGADRSPLGNSVEPDVDSERGRGMLLMNKLMDYVHVRSFPSGGTRVSMLRVFHPPL